MKTLLDAGSETSTITQDFITIRELRAEPVTGSVKDDCLETTTLGDACSYPSNYVEINIRSGDPVKIDGRVMMLVVPSIQDTEGRVDAILGAVLCRTPQK